MALETGTYIDSLNASNPVATDGLAQADDHMRLIKSTIKATFPSVTGAINATHTELNTVADGNTAATSTTLVDADRVPVNDDGTMVQVAMSDFKTYMHGSLTFPTSDGTAGQFMTTDGSNTLSFASVVAFLSGMIMPYAGLTAPSGWLLCFGQALNTYTYKDLHAIVSNTYGGTAFNAGVTDQSGVSTTFNLPDLRGRTIAGQDDMGGSSADRLTAQTGGLDGDTLGATGGTETHAILEAELASHSHFAVADTDGGSTSDTLTTGEFVNRTKQQPYGGGGEIFSYSLQGQSGTTATLGPTSTTGSGTAHNNVQPTIVLNYIIKT
tara:strand:+ start:1566 stop:2537 length:972 start_codon:yes stop_codon:yes gene_type:complete